MDSVASQILPSVTPDLAAHEPATAWVQFVHIWPDSNQIMHCCDSSNPATRVRGTVWSKLRNDKMLYYAVIFLVIALVAGILGFTGIAGAAVGIAKILFIVFLVLFVISLFYSRRGKH